MTNKEEKFSEQSLDNHEAKIRALKAPTDDENLFMYVTGYVDGEEKTVSSTTQDDHYAMFIRDFERHTAGREGDWEAEFLGDGSELEMNGELERVSDWEEYDNMAERYDGDIFTNYDSDSEMEIRIRSK